MGYYMGDYYRGDPGFLNFLGKAASVVGGFIPGVGGLISKAGGALAAATAKPGIKKVITTVASHPVLSAAAGAATVGAGVGAVTKMTAHPSAAGMAPTAAGARMRGMRGAGGRRRRMRVTNPKALRRAIRRTAGFARLAMKTIHLIHPRKKVRFGGFRHKRKK